MQEIGMTNKLALPTLIALCSISLGKPTISSLAVLGDMTISGSLLLSMIWLLLFRYVWILGLRRY